MAAVDLSDHDIDQLLSSAELSLAVKTADQSVALKGTQQVTLAPKTTATATAMVKTGKRLEQPELALRTPQLSKDKKVRTHHISTYFLPASPMRKSYPKLE